MSADLKELLSASYKSQKDAAALLKAKGYTYDPSLSSITDKVFVDSYGNPLVLHRGSKRVLEDWIQSNLPIAVGAEALSPRFQKSKEVIKQVKEKYPGTVVTSAGHSLGGSIAEKSGADRVITFNKGIGLGDIGKSIPGSQTDIRTKYDIPSLLSSLQTGGQKIELPGSINPYATHVVSTGLPENTFFV